jgi:hypothetical protein
LDRDGGIKHHYINVKSAVLLRFVVIYHLGSLFVFFSNFCFFLTSNLLLLSHPFILPKKQPQQVSAKRHYSKDASSARKAMEAVCEEQIAEMKDNLCCCCCFKQCFYETES